MTDPVPTTTHSHRDDFAQNQAENPPAHDDLTVGEILKNVHAEAGTHHPGKNGYRREKGKVEWVDEAAADEFIEKHGTKYPSDYKERYGQDWENDFFQPSGTPHLPTMNTPNPKTIASEAGKAAETVKRKSQDACCAVGEECSDLLAGANDAIRKNPIPSVVGAFVCGLAIGVLVMSGRSQETFEDRYIHDPLDHAKDALSDTLHRLLGPLKFW